MSTRVLVTRYSFPALAITILIVATMLAAWAAIEPGRPILFKDHNTAVVYDDTGLLSDGSGLLGAFSVGRSKAWKW